jgi:hypothetical protein
MAPTGAEIEALGHRMCWRYTPAANQFRGSTHTFNRTTLLNFARAVLARWGEQQVPAGYALVPVEVRNLYDFMCTAFVPVTGQHDQIAISLDLAKAAMLSAAPQPVVREPLSDEKVDSLCKVGPVYATEGKVTRTPTQYRDELEAAQRYGLRKGERAHGIGETP